MKTIRIKREYGLANTILIIIINFILAAGLAVFLYNSFVQGKDDGRPIMKAIAALLWLVLILHKTLIVFRGYDVIELTKKGIIISRQGGVHGGFAIPIKKNEISDITSIDSMPMLWLYNYQFSYFGSRIKVNLKYDKFSRTYFGFGISDENAAAIIEQLNDHLDSI